MPTYVYGCETCGHRFEKFQKFSDAALTECPECGAKIRRIFQPAGIVFKGSGWYSTDSRSGSRAHSSDTESKPADKSTSDSSTATKDSSKTTKEGSGDSSTAASSPAKPAASESAPPS